MDFLLTAYNMHALWNLAIVHILLNHTLTIF